MTIKDVFIWNTFFFDCDIKFYEYVVEWSSQSSEWNAVGCVKVPLHIASDFYLLII